MIFPAINLHLFQGFSMAMLNNQMVILYIYIHNVNPIFPGFPFFERNWKSWPTGLFWRAVLRPKDQLHVVGDAYGHVVSHVSLTNLRGLSQVGAEAAMLMLPSKKGQADKPHSPKKNRIFIAKSLGHWAVKMETAYWFRLASNQPSFWGSRHRTNVTTIACW